MVSPWRICVTITRRLTRNVKLLVALCVLTAVSFYLKYATRIFDHVDISKKEFDGIIVKKSSNKIDKYNYKKSFQNDTNIIVHGDIYQSVINGKTGKPHVDNIKSKLCYNIHAFYYSWYGNPSHDGEYVHWNHKYLPHWDKRIAQNYPLGRHIPPDDISSNFYPVLGPYSSGDPDVIRNHMEQLSLTGVGVIAASYYPPGKADDNGKDWAHIFPLIFQAAENFKIKVTFQIEPYKGRSESTVLEDIKNIVESYSAYQSFYKFSYKKKTLPLIYIYDSYHIQSSDWSKLLKPGPLSMRNGPYDAFVIGLVVESKDKFEMVNAGFDGFYTYFASNGFTYGSTRDNWKALKNFADVNKLLFIPSVGPGYVDTRVRPWNNENTRSRLKGKYYSESWKEALEQDTELISITSFNEWHEGTQIEKAVPKRIDGFKYSDYKPFKPEYYLDLTRNFIKTFMRRKIL